MLIPLMKNWWKLFAKIQTCSKKTNRYASEKESGPNNLESNQKRERGKPSQILDELIERDPLMNNISWLMIQHNDTI